MKLSITGLSKAVVLKALYDHITPQPQKLFSIDAEEIIETTPNVTYVQGQAIMVDFTSDEEIDVTIYNRIHGSAQEALEKVFGK